MVDLMSVGKRFARCVFALMLFMVAWSIAFPAEAHAETADAYVSALTVRTQTDGVGPFDSDDMPGNDSSNVNRRVRSFDDVSYTLEYVTALSDESVVVTDPVTLELRVELSCAPSKAQFNLDQMRWAESPRVVYEYSDGTSSEGYDETKVVVKQVFYATRTLRGTGADDRVPGAGQLSVGVSTKAAVEGEVINPTFSLRVIGDERDESCSGVPVTVTSRCRLNVKLYRYAGVFNTRGHFNFDDGTFSRAADAPGHMGSHQAFSLSLQLYNTTASKGFKGLELPTGPISFDFTMMSTVNGEDMTSDPDWAAALWDYAENEGGVRLHRIGKLGRDMSPISVSQAVEDDQTALNDGANKEISCYEGGTWTIEPDDSAAGLYHVTVTDYEFDRFGFVFPTQYNSQGYVPGRRTVPANVGDFSTGFVQFACLFPEIADATTNVYLRATVSNLDARSESGSHVTEQQVTTDDMSGFTSVVYTPGSISKWIRWTTVPGGASGNSPQVNTGQGYGPAGTHSLATSIFTYRGDDALTSVDMLIKFDDRYLYVPDKGDGFDYAFSVSMPDSVRGASTAYFAAKPDGTGWEDQTELNSASEENLVFYDTLAELEASGKTCVGILVESRDTSIYDSIWNAAATSRLTIWVRSDAPVGAVGSIVNDIRVWKDVDAPRITEVQRNADGSYGLGDASMPRRTYAEGYPRPFADMYFPDYTPSQYENGTMVGGHTGGSLKGDSLLVVGARNAVEIEALDPSTLDKKVTFDMDAGERQVTYRVRPSIKALGETPTTGVTTDMHLSALLPADVHYVAGSASRAPSEVVVNDDGTTTITWDFDVEVNTDIEPILITCGIGAAGTPDDVENNQQIDAVATVHSGLDGRPMTSSNGNRAATTIVCVRLAAVSLSKTVTPESANVGSPHTWSLRFGNSSETDVTACRIADVLPWDGDARGSRFGGLYRIDSITLDLANAPLLLEELDGTACLQMTSDRQAHTVGDVLIAQGLDTLPWTALGVPERDGSMLVWHDVNLMSDDVTALRFDIGTMHGQEYLTIKLEVSTSADGGFSDGLWADGSGGVASDGDVYANGFAEYALGQADVVRSNTVRTEVRLAELEVTKHWQDSGWENRRPDSVMIDVLANGKTVRTIELSENVAWSWSERMPYYDENGRIIDYDVSEASVDDYSTAISGDASSGFVVTNSITLTKNGVQKSASEAWL